MCVVYKRYVTYCKRANTHPSLDNCSTIENDLKYGRPCFYHIRIFFTEKAKMPKGTVPIVPLFVKPEIPQLRSE